MKRDPGPLPILDAYVRAHNECVLTGLRDRLGEVLARDAVMIFASGRAGPFVGRESILDAFRTAPPTDALEIAEILWSDETSVLARYSWAVGASEGGRLYLVCGDRRIALLVVLPASPRRSTGDAGDGHAQRHA